MIASELIATIQTSQFSSSELDAIVTAASKRAKQVAREEALLKPIKPGDEVILNNRARPIYLRGRKVGVEYCRDDSVGIVCPNEPRKFGIWAGRTALVPRAWLTPAGKQLTLGERQE